MAIFRQNGALTHEQIREIISQMMEIEDLWNMAEWSFLMMARERDRPHTGLQARRWLDDLHTRYEVYMGRL